MSDALKDTIRAKLRAGLLRRDESVRTWFGRGQDHACVACERTIGRTDRECEADFADGVTLRFHRECFYVWDDERRGARDDRRRPDEACVITSVILSMALCLPCIVEKTGIPAPRVRAFFTRVKATVELTQAPDQCAECRVVTMTYRIG